MLVSSFSPNSYKASFGAKLNIDSPTRNFPYNEKEIRVIQNMFERATKNSDGKMLLIFDDQKCVKPHYTLLYKNGEHKDMVSGYILSKLPTDICDFSDQMVKFFNLFLKREPVLNEIKALKFDLKEKTNQLLGDIVDIMPTFWQRKMVKCVEFNNECWGVASKQ